MTLLGFITWWTVFGLGTAMYVLTKGESLKKREHGTLENPTDPLVAIAVVVRCVIVWPVVWIAKLYVKFTQ